MAAVGPNVAKMLERQQDSACPGAGEPCASGCIRDGQPLMPRREGTQNREATCQRLDQLRIGIIVNYGVTPPSTWFICTVM